MNPLRATFSLPQPDGSKRIVNMEIPQHTGDEGLRVFDLFLKHYGPKPERDPHFEKVLADDKHRRAKAEKAVAADQDPPKPVAQTQRKKGTRKLKGI